ncbi:cytochrome P450 [Streptomyces alanosinicus]|uniref:Cytochrome P450 n=2 Tax=Streptomyces alanosinicus TaxID=68171 RepID=A0A918YSV0_9ACTN|nr:cytochrome P450 [Streptomyces alanosinicus]
MPGAAPAPALPPLRASDIPLADPYSLYARYRSGDPVHFGADGSWYVFRHSDVAQILADRAYVRGPRPAWVPADECPHLARTVRNWMVFMDPPLHGRVRKLAAAAFTLTVVRNLEPRIRQLASRLADTLLEEDEVDLVERFAAPLPLLVIGELLGVPPADRDWFRTRALDLQQATRARAGRSPNAFAVADTAARELDAYFLTELRRRRTAHLSGAQYGDDLIGAMAERAGAAGLGDDVVTGTCVHLLTAGHETSTLLLCKGLLALLAHPDQLAALRGATAPGQMAGAVEELIRYDPPVQMVTRARQPNRDGQLAGRAIPGGGSVVLVLGSANRDPARFSHPDRLDITRTPGGHLGFGTGPHYCLGTALARVEAAVGLTELLRRMPHPVLATQPVYGDDLVFHGPSRMLVRTR